MLLLHAREVVDHHADEEVDREDVADEHPDEGEGGHRREVVPHGCIARLAGTHHVEERQLPLVARRHDVQQPHAVREVVE